MSKFHFKSAHTFEQRKREAERILAKYPDRIPIIVENAPKSNIPEIDKHKYLVPADLTVGQFVYVIRKRIRLEAEQALFVFINGEIPQTITLMSDLYEKHKDVDNFLYFLIHGESTFG